MHYAKHAPLVPPASSYALRPFDESLITEWVVPWCEQGEFVLLVPGAESFPVALLSDPAFANGCAWGYEDGLVGLHEELTPLRLANWIFQQFWCGSLEPHEAPYSWYVGFVLGALSALAQVDRLLALVGIAHLCFLLTHIPDVLGDAYKRAVYHAEHFHRQALATYRECVRDWRTRGANTVEAFRFALGAGAVVAGRGIGGDGWPLDL